MKKIIYAFIMLVGLYSCSDNLIDGGVRTANVNKTTVEYLRSNAKFDTVLILFEKAGIMSQLDKQNTTVIIPTDYSVTQFVKQIQEQKRMEADDENIKYTFKDLVNDISLYKDSLKMYIVPQVVTRDMLAKTTSGLIETKSLLGNNVEIALTETKLYTEWLPNSDVKLIHYKNVINGLDPADNNGIPNADKDVDNICQTTGIMTTTGVLHVLEDTHNLFFNKRPRL
jgi:hypothetical protein